MYKPAELIINTDGSIYHLGLQPHQLAETVIVVGDPTRVSMVSSFFSRIEYRIQKREFITHTGLYKGKRFSVVSSGIGTDNVEILMTELDALCNIDCHKRVPHASPTSLTLVRIGTSGAIQEDLNVGSYLASCYAIGIDTLMCFYDYKPPTTKLQHAAEQLQTHLGLPFVPYATMANAELLACFGDIAVGTTLTCPGFYAPQGRQLRAAMRQSDWLERLCSFSYEDLRLTNLEMETAGYYAMAHMLGHRMLSLNAILANRLTGEFATSPEKIVRELIAFTLDRLSTTAGEGK